MLKRMAKIKKSAVTNIGEDTEQLDLSFIAGRSIKWYDHYEKLVLSSSYMYNYSMTQQFHS